MLHGTTTWDSITDNIRASQTNRLVDLHKLIEKRFSEDPKLGELNLPVYIGVNFSDFGKDQETLCLHCGHKRARVLPKLITALYEVVPNNRALAIIERAIKENNDHMSNPGFADHVDANDFYTCVCIVTPGCSYMVLMTMYTYQELETFWIEAMVGPIKHAPCPDSWTEEQPR